MFWGILFLVIGIGWILQQLGYIPDDVEYLVPVIFIAIGLSILFGQKDTNCWHFWDKKKKDKE